MRNRLMTGTAALLLASATFAGAQQTSATTSSGSSGGTIDIGGRFTNTDGDEARYQRYRDLRNGANVNFLYNKETDKYTFDFGAKNVGYRDGSYVLNYNSSRLKLNARFDQTPLNYAYYTRTPYNCTAGNCALDPATRADVQRWFLSNPRPNTGVGVPQAASQLVAGSVYSGMARPFDLQSRRDTMAADLRFSATNNLDFMVGFNSYKRSGNQPYGMGFAFNNASELPMVIDNRETEISAAVEWASHQGMFHLGFEHSKFDQNIPSMTFDNPLFATDFCRANAANPPGACYDPSGYSNGNGPAMGRMAMAPSNSLNTVNWMGMVKLPAHTTANASLAVGANHQDAALIPWTTNPNIANANVYAAFPELAALGRNSAQMRVNYTIGTMNVSSRPVRDFSITARYRFNSRNDFTRAFDAVEYVRFDAVPEETGGETEPFNINRNTLDVTASYTAIPHSAIRVGYGFNELEHGVRATQGWQDNTVRFMYDTVGNQYFTLRAQYEYTKRKTVGLDEEDLVESGSQPALRFFDEAARKRNRLTAIAEVTPTSSLGLNFSVFHGKDDYEGADAEQEFGLLDNKNTGWSAGVNYAPSAKVNFGADYGRETFDSLQQSRNANPAPDPSWTDPSRNWNLNVDETVNNFSLYVNLVKPIAKTDIRASYDLSDSDQGFLHGGPRISALSALNTFVGFPNVTNKRQTASVDLRYSLSKKVGVGFSYWYEKFDVSDYATINTAGPATLPRTDLGAQTENPRFDWLGALITGYGNRPYTGQTGIIRVFYEF